MLNYIWAGLIGFSLVFAMVYDVRDLARDTYRNGEPVPVRIEFPEGYSETARSVPVVVRFTDFAERYGVDAPDPGPLEGTLVQGADGRELRFARDAELPEPLATIRQMTSERDNDLRGPVPAFEVTGDAGATAGVRFARVRFVKLQAIADAAFSMAETAVTIALGLIGVIALWMGLLKIAETSGLIQVVVRLAQPVLRPLFPEIPRDHPALGLIVLNLSANMLGLGNAATPLGIKAMESLQELNTDKDTATNSMVMLLAMNTASVQLVPPVLLVAIMGLQINKLIFAILIVTAISLAVAIVAAKLLGRMPGYRKTDPNRPTETV
jgi:spore maturation protein A